MVDKLEAVISAINKTFGENTIGRLKDMPTMELDRISSGSPYLDWAIGGGWPRGRTVELYGPYSSGKSLIALRAIKEAQSKRLGCVYLDSENAFDPEFARTVGVDVDNLIISQVSAGEELFDMVDMLLDSEVALIVIDSIASILPRYEEEESMEKQTIGLQARLMSKALRKITAKAAKNKTLILFINQIREQVGAYGNPEITSGGRALGFYASLRVQVRKGESLLREKRVIGQEVKFKVMKSKVCQPFRDGYFLFYHPDKDNPSLELFDVADELVSMLLIHKKIERKGAYYFVNEDKSFQGREELEQEIRNNSEFKEELLGRLKENE